MLAAVPSGEYEVRASLDLTPVFGKIETVEIRKIVPPPPDAFERRLAELASEDPTVRRAALSDLPFFGTRRKEVGPVLVSCLRDPDGILRRMALAMLQGFKDVAAAHAGTILGILESREGRVRGERTNAALLVSRTTPASDRARAALEQSVEDAEPWERSIFRSALDAYRTRTKSGDR